MTKRLLTLLLTVTLLTGISNAQSFTYNGITYKHDYLSTLTVVHNIDDEGSNYSGLNVANIADTIIRAGETYYVTKIGDGAFEGCTTLKSINIGNYVTTIDENAFRDCTGLTGSLLIPNSVVDIQDYAFYNCTGLNGDISLGKNCRYLGEDAFGRDDKRLTMIKSMHIYYSEDHVTAGGWDGCPFGNSYQPGKRTAGLNPGITIYVPKSLLEKYRSLADGDPFTNNSVDWWGYFEPDCFQALEDEVTEPVTGDVDGSAMVDVDDVNAMINLILNFDQYKDKYPGSADLDGNGMVDVDDVNALINMILSK